MSNDVVFMGYKIRRDILHFTPETVLFYNESNTVTVEMAKDALDYAFGMLTRLTRNNSMTDAYCKARKVLISVKRILLNQPPLRCTKSDLKAMVEVLEEITNEKAVSDAEKENNARRALICKLLINWYAK